jgi:hypothetical protein
MPLRAKPIEAEVTLRFEYVVKLKPAYPVRIRKLKVRFTYTFYLSPPSSIGGLFLCSVLFRREPAPQSLKRFADFSVIRARAANAFRARRPPHLPGNGG